MYSLACIQQRSTFNSLLSHGNSAVRCAVLCGPCVQVDNNVTQLVYNICGSVPILLIEVFSNYKKVTLFSLITSSFIVNTIGLLVIEYVHPLIHCNDEMYLKRRK